MCQTDSYRHQGHSTWCIAIEWEEVEEPSNVRMSMTPAQLMHRRVLEQRKHMRGNYERGGGNTELREGEGILNYERGREY